MTIKDSIDEALATYADTQIEMVLIGFELWRPFCREAGLTPTLLSDGKEKEATYKGVRFREGITPDQISVLTAS